MTAIEYLFRKARKNADGSLSVARDVVKEIRRRVREESGKRSRRREAEVSE